MLYTFNCFWLPLTILTYTVKTSEELEINHFGDKGIDNAKEEEKINQTLLRTNLYALVFVNIYILSFVVLMLHCTQCVDNDNQDNVIAVEGDDWT